jgi:hypothetical protein
VVQYLWLLLGGAQEMRAGWLLVAGLVLLGAASPLWAGPFEEVPREHWAYRACARLASLGLLADDGATAFSGDPLITRFEFAIALVEPLSAIDRTLEAIPADSDLDVRLPAVLRSLHVSPRNSEHEIATALSDLRRLAEEFADVLQMMDSGSVSVADSLRRLADEDAIRAWRLDSLAHPRQGRALAAGSSSFVSSDTVHLPLAHGTVGLSLTSPQEAPELLDYLAQSAASERGSGPAGVASTEAAVVDPQISRLRTSYEYGVGSALTLSLAYEEIARRGQGLAELDAASLTSLGIGYQITPSASVKLSYSLLEYSNYVLDTPLLRDRVAETAVSIEF